MSNALQFTTSAATGSSASNWISDFLMETMPSKIVATPYYERAAILAKGGVDAGSPRGFGYRRLNRFAVVNGRLFQLHATRGWKCVGRVS